MDEISACTSPGHTFIVSRMLWCSGEGVVAQWCNPLTSQSEQSGGVGSMPGRAAPLCA